MSRPRSENSKNLRFEIRISEETLQKMDYCAEKLGITKTEVLHRGLDLVKAEIDKK